MRVKLKKMVKKKIKKIIACGLAATCVLQCDGNIGTAINGTNVAYAAETVENGFKIVDGVLVEYTGSATNVVIPNSVSSFESKVFRGNANIVSVVIPGTVKSIPTAAFHSCTSLQQVTINEGVTSVDKTAFYDCPQLTKVIIPSSVQSIDKTAFPTALADTVEIYGNTGSVAESYAVENGFKFVDMANSQNESGNVSGNEINYVNGVIPETKKSSKLELIQTSLTSFNVNIPKNSNAKKYRVTCSCGGKKVSAVTTANSVVSFGSLTKGKKYLVEIVVKKDNGKKLAWSAMKGYITLSKKFRAQITGGVFDEGSVKLQWNKVVGAKKYKVSYADNKAMTGAKSQTVTATSSTKKVQLITTESTSINAYDLNGDVYFKVTALNAKNNKVALESDAYKITIDTLVLNDRFQFSNPYIDTCMSLSSPYFKVFYNKVADEDYSQLCNLIRQVGYPSPLHETEAEPGCTPVPYERSGHCFGMSCLTAMAYGGTISKKFLGGEKLSTIKAPSQTGRDETFYNVVNYYQNGCMYGKCGKELYNIDKSEAKRREKLVNHIKTSKSPVVFFFQSFKYVYDEKKKEYIWKVNACHAINALNIKTVDEVKAMGIDTTFIADRKGMVIECLDSNHPLTQVYLFISDDYSESFFINNYDWESYNPNLPLEQQIGKEDTMLINSFIVEESQNHFDSVNLEKALSGSTMSVKGVSEGETDAEEKLSVTTNYLNFRIECSDGTYAVVENGARVDGTYEISDAKFYNDRNEEYDVRYDIACPKKGAIITVIPAENQKSNIENTERKEYTTSIGKNGINGYSDLLTSEKAVAMTVDYDGDVTTKSVNGEATKQALIVMNANGTKMSENSICTIIQGSDSGIKVEGEAGNVNVKTDNSTKVVVSVNSETQNLNLGEVVASGAGISISGKDNAFTVKDEKGNEVVTKDMGCSVVFVTGTDKVLDGLTHLEKDSKIAEPTGLEKEGYVLEGWYTNSACTSDFKWNFETNTISDDLTLYANWVKVVKAVSKVKTPSVKVLKSGKVKVTWKKCSDVTGYEIQISTNKNFKKSVTTKKVIKKNNYTKKLKKGTYYVRVRAYVLDETGKKVYGKFSSTKKKSVKK